MAFYVVRGDYKLEELLNMGYVKKLFLHHARQEHYKEEEAKWKFILNKVMGGEK